MAAEERVTSMSDPEGLKLSDVTQAAFFPNSSCIYIYIYTYRFSLGCIYDFLFSYGFTMDSGLQSHPPMSQAMVQAPWKILSRERSKQWGNVAGEEGHEDFDWDEKR